MKNKITFTRAQKDSWGQKYTEKMCGVIDPQKKVVHLEFRYVGRDAFNHRDLSLDELRGVRKALASLKGCYDPYDDYHVEWAEPGLVLEEGRDGASLRVLMAPKGEVYLDTCREVPQGLWLFSIQLSIKAIERFDRFCAHAETLLAA